MQERVSRNLVEGYLICQRIKLGFAGHDAQKGGSILDIPGHDAEGVKSIRIRYHSVTRDEPSCCLEPDNVGLPGGVANAAFCLQCRNRQYDINVDKSKLADWSCVYTSAPTPAKANPKLVATAEPVLLPDAFMFG